MFLEKCDGVWIGSERVWASEVGQGVAHDGGDEVGFAGDVRTMGHGGAVEGLERLGNGVFEARGGLDGVVEAF